MIIKLLILLTLILISITSYAEIDPAHSYGCKIKEELIAEKLQLIARHDVKKNGEMRRSGILQAGNIELTMTSEEIDGSGTIEGFLLPGKKSVFNVPIINLNFTLNENDIVYVCFHLDEENKDNNHLTLFFLEGKNIRENGWNIFNLKPTVKMSPATIEIQTVEGTVDTISDIFKGFPVVGMIVKLLNNVVHEVMDIVHKFLDHLIGVGVTKIVITGKKLELYYGMELLDQTILKAKQNVEKPNPIVDGQPLARDQK